MPFRGEPCSWKDGLGFMQNLQPFLTCVPNGKVKDHQFPDVGSLCQLGSLVACHVIISARKLYIRMSVLALTHHRFATKQKRCQALHSRFVHQEIRQIGNRIARRLCYENVPQLLRRMRDAVYFDELQIRRAVLDLLHPRSGAKSEFGQQSNVKILPGSFPNDVCQRGGIVIHRYRIDRKRSRLNQLDDVPLGRLGMFHAESF